MPTGTRRPQPRTRTWHLAIAGLLAMAGARLVLRGPGPTRHLAGQELQVEIAPDGALRLQRAPLEPVHLSARRFNGAGTLAGVEGGGTSAVLQWREATETVALDGPGLALAWRFERPLPPGPLEVRFGLAAPDGAPTTLSRHGLTLSAARWIGADGRTTEVPLRQEGAELAWHVPAPVVAATRFPAVLDPWLRSTSESDAPVFGPFGRSTSPAHLQQAASDHEGRALFLLGVAGGQTTCVGRAPDGGLGPYTQLDGTRLGDWNGLVGHAGEFGWLRRIARACEFVRLGPGCETRGTVPVPCSVDALAALDDGFVLALPVDGGAPIAVSPVAVWWQGRDGGQAGPFPTSVTAAVPWYGLGASAAGVAVAGQLAATGGGDAGVVSVAWVNPHTGAQISSATLPRNQLSQGEVSVAVQGDVALVSHYNGARRVRRDGQILDATDLPALGSVGTLGTGFVSLANSGLAARLLPATPPGALTLAAMTSDFDGGQVSLEVLDGPTPLVVLHRAGNVFEVREATPTLASLGPATAPFVNANEQHRVSGALRSDAGVLIAWADNRTQWGARIWAQWLDAEGRPASAPAELGPLPPDAWADTVVAFPSGRAFGLYASPYGARWWFADPRPGAASPPRLDGGDNRLLSASLLATTSAGRAFVLGERVLTTTPGLTRTVTVHRLDEGDGHRLDDAPLDVGAWTFIRLLGAAADDTGLWFGLWTMSGNVLDGGLRAENHLYLLRHDAGVPEPLDPLPTLLEGAQGFVLTGEALCVDALQSGVLSRECTGPGAPALAVRHEPVPGAVGLFTDDDGERTHLALCLSDGGATWGAFERDGGLALRASTTPCSPFTALAPGRLLVVDEVQVDLFDAGPVSRVRRRLIEHQALGRACLTDEGCLSGWCVDGVCCDGPCGAGATTDCQACAVAAGAAADGHCAPLPATSACRAATGPCDLPEACDGVLAECPMDRAAPEGADCPAGICQAGACVAPADDGGTLPTPEVDGGDGPPAGPRHLAVGCGCSALALAPWSALAFLLVSKRRRRATN